MNEGGSGVLRQTYHLIGIGGIGMSGLARMLLHRGCFVTGSDISENVQTGGLARLGAKVHIGHSRENIAGTPTIVYSSAISDDNPEMAEARKRDLHVIRRAELLAQFFNAKKGIAVSGTHGKTTTTALIALVLTEAGLRPDAFIGGEVEELGGNLVCGDGEYAVAEADESDGSLLQLNPCYSIVTNIDGEHFSYFNSIDEIVELFRKFISQTALTGCVYLNIDNEYLDEIHAEYRGNKVSCSVRGEADICARDIRMRSFGSEYDVVYRGRLLGAMELNIPGLHNVSNSLGPIALAADLGIDFGTIRKALSGFHGVARRFEVKGEVDRVLIIDDYAHHPTEIMATADSAKTISGQKRIIGVFQPHRFSRTKHFQDRFSEAFDDFDELVLTDIYSATEKPIEGIDGRTILSRVLERGRKNVEYFEDLHDIPDYLSERLRPGDVVVTMGAGNINIVAEKLVEKLKEKASVR